MGDTDRKLFVLDTNILLHEPLAIYSFQEHDVVIPMTVLEELDRIKDSKRDVARDARVAIRQIANIVEDATHEELTTTGVRIANKHTNMPDTARLIIVQDVTDLPTQGLKLVGDTHVPDNRIINSALYYQWAHPEQEVILVTNDINMRIKAQGAGVQKVQAYSHDTTVSDIDLLHQGYIEVDGDFSKVKTYYENGQLKEIGSFFKGKADGLWVSFDENGNKISQGEFKNGEKHGDWLIWTPQGKALYHISYEKNVRTAATTVTE